MSSKSRKNTPEAMAKLMENIFEQQATAKSMAKHRSKKDIAEIKKLAKNLEDKFEGLAMEGRRTSNSKRRGFDTPTKRHF